MHHEPHKSKKLVQNDNAAKFRLDSLVMEALRHSVIYKNILRSMRKYYSAKFLAAGYCLSRNESEKMFSNLKDFVGEEFSETAAKLKFGIEDLAVSLGAIVNPCVLQKLFWANPEYSARVSVVFGYLYKFSFQRLQEFLDDPVMMLFFFRMIEDKCSKTFRSVTPLHSLATSQACMLLLEHSCFDIALSQHISRTKVTKTLKECIRVSKQEL